ncbi:MAG: endonuclease V [Candidatus Thorarchaeota archaeon]
MSLEELAREQEEKSKFVRKYDDPQYDNSIVIGVDVSYFGNKAVGCAVVADLTTQKIVDISLIETEIDSEYISGFFQLREGPIILELLGNFKNIGTVLIDGNGILHPRRFGLASFVGLELDIQTVGVAKSLMLGNLGPRSDDNADVIHNGEIVGRALWLGRRKPIYISIGHRISLETAFRVVRDSCIDDYPNVLHQAHVQSKEALEKMRH